MEIDVNKERCLVCDSQDQTPLHSLTDPFPHSENFETVRKASGSSTNILLNQQLSVIFLLRKVLRLDKSFLEETLQKTESNPSLWNLKLCRVCYRTFEEADFVFTRLRKLHVEFRELSNILCKKLIQSVDSEPPKLVAENVSVSTAPRARRRKRRGRPKQTKNEISHHLEDSSLTVAERIRKARFSQGNKDSTMDHDDFNEFMPPDISFLRSSSPPLLKSCIKTELSLKKNLRVQLTDICSDKERMKTPEEKNEEHLPDEENDIEMEREGIPEEHSIEDTSNYDDMDDTPDWNPSDEDEREDGECDNEVIVDDKDSDSDFEIPAPKFRKRTSRPRPRKSTDDGMGIILKAVKMENTFQYICPKCKEVFENAALCDEHILHKHYDGKWPKHFACHICEDVSFKGEHWLRHHYEMRHPGTKWAVDETIERSIDEGLMPEITYEVIPAGKPLIIPENPMDELRQQDEESEHFSLFNRTVDNPPENAFSIPVVQATGQIRHLVLPNSIKKLPPEVFALIKVGEDEKPCKGCDKKFPTEIQLRAHQKRVHNGDNMAYDCPMCPKTFERIGKVMIHVQRTHVLSFLTCDKCGNHFKEEILLKAHIQRQHFGIEYPYKCVKCNVRYPGRSSLNKHLKRVHRLQIASYFLLTKKPKKKPGELPKKRRFRNKGRKKMERKFVCETCLENGVMNMKFVSEEELDTHIKRRHMGIPRPYPCPICDKRYSTPARVEDHMSTHTVRSDLHIDDQASVKAPPLPFVCHPCDKQFRNRALYNAHLKGRNHLDVRPFVCEFCSQGFSGIKYLKNHQSQKHHQELNIDPFKCKFCSKVLSSGRTLNDHIKLHHTKDANYSCPYCDVQFQHISNMEQHVNALHTKSTHFLCPQCPKTFLRDYYLKNHMARVHCSKKPFECEHCGKEFSDKPTFNRHLEAHSGVLHSCPHCEKSGFKTRHALRVHRKTFHKAIFEELERKKKLAAIVKPQDAESPISNTNDDSISNEAFDNSSSDTRGMESSKMESQDLVLKDDQQDNTSNFQNDSELNFFS